MFQQVYSLINSFIHTSKTMDEVIYIPVATCRPALKKILSTGGCAELQVGEEFRTLQHFSGDKPEKQLPWPLSKLQSFRFIVQRNKNGKGPAIGGIQFPTLFKNHEPIEEAVFDNTQVEEGIAYFLKGAAPDDEVQIQYFA